MSATRPGASSTMTTTEAAATSPASCVRARMASRMADREPDADSAKPPVSPAARFAAPSARNSWFASISSPVRVANARPVSVTSE